MKLRRAVRASVGCRWISFTTKLPQDVRNMPAEDAFRGGTRLELRWEIFNLLNRVNLGTFQSTSVRSSLFGTIASTPDVDRGNPVIAQGGPRAMQWALKVLF